MFGIGRRTSPGQLAKSELNESLNHLVQAASYAADGVGASVGPRVQAARSAVGPTATAVRDRASTGWESTMTTFAPLAGAARDGARQAGTVAKKAKVKNMRLTQKKKPRRRGWVTGLLIAGTVAGAAGAVALRRRRQQEQQWDEYSAGRSVEQPRDDVDTLVINTPEPTAPASAGIGSTGGPSPVIGGTPPVTGGQTSTSSGTTSANTGSTSASNGSTSASNGSTSASAADKARHAAEQVGETVTTKAHQVTENAKQVATKATEKGDSASGGSFTGTSTTSTSARH